MLVIVGIILVFLFGFIIGAISQSWQPNPTESPTQTELALVNTSTTRPPAATDLMSQADPPNEIGLVVDVVDGDTIKVNIAGETFTIRYIGIDTPEVQLGEWMGQEAKEANQTLVLGKEVNLVKDISNTDQYGRLLRYVYLLDGTFVNGVLVEQGFAESLAYPPDTKYQAYFDQLQVHAQELLLGLWSIYQNVGQNSPIEITQVNKKDEYVQLTNRSDQPIDLTGWILRSDRGNQDCSLRGILQPGDQLTIWARKIDEDKGGFNCGFEDCIWSNSSSDPAVLIDNSNQIVDRYPSFQ